jgi:carbon monoxide dehydrogenase subunit G
MLRFEGDRDFTQAPPDLWAKLTDANFLVECLPDVDTVKEVDSDHAVLVVRPGLAFVRGTLDVTLRLSDKSSPSSARMTLFSKGIGSSSTVETSVNLSPQGTGTHLHWSAEVKELTGLLKMVPSGLIRGAAQKIINDMWTAVEARLNAGT